MNLWHTEQRMSIAKVTPVNVHELTYMLALLNFCRENVFGSHTNQQSIKNWELVYLVVKNTLVCVLVKSIPLSLVG